MAGVALMLSVFRVLSVAWYVSYWVFSIVYVKWAWVMVGSVALWEMVDPDPRLTGGGGGYQVT